MFADWQEAIQCIAFFVCVASLVTSFGILSIASELRKKNENDEMALRILKDIKERLNGICTEIYNTNKK